MFKRIKGEIIIFSFFVLLTMIITYPVILKMDSSVFGDSEWMFDTPGTLYGIWWLKYAWVNRFPYTFNHLISFPFGIDTSTAAIQPCLFYPLLMLSLCQNEFFAYNLSILVSFVLSSIFVYYLVCHLTKNKLVSMVSGIIYSFCPGHFLQAFSHHDLAIIQWMPLYVISLIKLDEVRSYRNAVFWAFAFSLVLLMNYYYGFFMVIFTAGFILFTLGYSIWTKSYKAGSFRDLRIRVFKTFKVVVLAGVLALVIMLPFTYSTIKTALLPEKSTVSVSMEYERSYEDVYKYAARPADYFLPSEYHPVFGKFSLWFVKSYMGGGRHWAEKTLYLGVTPLFLAVVSLIGWIKRRRLKMVDQRENFYIPTFSFLAVFAFYCSLAPVIKLWGIKIPTPSYFLYRIAPMFRIYARIGFVVTLCVAVLAGFGLKYILVSIKSRGKQVVVTLAFLFLILFEYTVVPPFRNVDFSKTPAVYEWLALQPEDVVIAEYPLGEGNLMYMFYQRVHRKKMINGAQRGTLADAIGIKVGEITNSSVSPLLSYLGVNYVIIHKNTYNSEKIKKIDNMPGLIFIKDFPAARVYEVVAEPLRFMYVQRNFARQETWDDGSKWQWMDNNAQFWLCNTSPGNIFIDLKFRALSFTQDRTLDVFLNDNLVKEIKISAVSSPDLAAWVSLESIELPPGESIIRFYTPEGSQKIADAIYSGDMRNVSIAFSDLRVETGE